MKAAIVDQNKNIIVREIRSPQLPQGGALIKATGCGICGSDLDKLLNREIIDGTVLGHEVVGIIDKLSTEAKQRFKNLYEGQRVSVAHHVPCLKCYYCLHSSPSMCISFKTSNIVPGGFCEYIAISKEHLDNTAFSIPDHITDHAASCIEPLACCIRAVDRISEHAGSSILLIGLGFIGLMTAQYLQYKDFRVLGIDTNPERVDMAKRHNILQDCFAIPDNAVDSIKKITDNRGADTVFLSVVTPQTLAIALKAVRDGGNILLFTSSKENVPMLNPNELYFRELTVITSYSSSLMHLKQAYDLIVNSKVDLEPLVTHVYPLNALAQAMEDYSSGKALKVFITL